MALTLTVVVFIEVLTQGIGQGSSMGRDNLAVLWAWSGDVLKHETCHL